MFTGQAETRVMRIIIHGGETFKKVSPLSFKILQAGATLREALIGSIPCEGAHTAKMTPSSVDTVLNVKAEFEDFDVYCSLKT